MAARGVSLPAKVNDMFPGVSAKLEAAVQQKKQLTPQEIEKRRKDAEEAAAQAEADDVGLGLVRIPLFASRFHLFDGPR